MLRRLNYLFPNNYQVHAVVDELVINGIDFSRMHTLAKESVDLSGLPPATAHQRSNIGAKLESWFWNTNLIVFFMALVLMLISAAASKWYLVLLGLIVCAATVSLGNYFARKIPKAHLDQFRGELSHGEILLMVDVPHWRLYEIEQIITRHHPEANPGGVGWTIEALHI